MRNKPRWYDNPEYQCKPGKRDVVVLGLFILLLFFIGWAQAVPTPKWWAVICQFVAVIY